MPLYYLWLASAIAALAGTVYWIRIPRHSPNKDTELFGLTLLYVWLAGLSAIYYAVIWLVKGCFEGWN